MHYFNFANYIISWFYLNFWIYFIFNNVANLIAQVRRVLSNEIFVIPEESSSLFPSESNGVSSPNIKSEDLMESSLPIQLIRQFLP